MLLTDHQLEGACVKPNLGSDRCVAFRGVTTAFNRLGDKLESILNSTLAGMQWCYIQRGVIHLLRHHFPSTLSYRF